MTSLNGPSGIDLSLQFLERFFDVGSCRLLQQKVEIPRGGAHFNKPICSGRSGQTVHMRLEFGQPGWILGEVVNRLALFWEFLHIQSPQLCHFVERMRHCFPPLLSKSNRGGR